MRRGGHRIRGAMPLLALDRARQWTDGTGFGWLHGLGRRAYLKLGLPALSRALGERVVARNSALNGERFNIFGSDLDCAVLLSEGYEEDRLHRVRERYASVRAVLPPLGELEIYTESEWRRIDEDSAAYGRWLELIRAIRKTAWEEAEWRRATDPYHRNKARDSIARIFSRLGVREKVHAHGNAAVLSGAVAEAVASLAPGVEADAPAGLVARHSPYLDCPVGLPEPGSRDGIRLSPGSVTRFLAILPDAEALFPELAVLLRRLGRETDVASLRAAILRRELYLCRSVSRVGGSALTPSKRGELEEWMGSLTRELARVGAPC